MEVGIMRSHNNRSRGFAAVPLFFATGMAFALTFFFPLEVQASLIELTARPSTGNIVYWSTLGTPNISTELHKHGRRHRNRERRQFGRTMLRWDHWNVRWRFCAR